MQPCPDCQTLLEPFEIICHGCGKTVANAAPPVIKEVPPDGAEIEESCQQWLDRGKEALDGQDFERAAAYLTEARKRTKVHRDGKTKELEVGTLLAQALEKDEKLAEAAQQYQLLAQKTSDPEKKAQWNNKAEELEKKSDVLIDQVMQDSFVELQGPEIEYVPLYCNTCKRLLSESEVYGFRKRVIKKVICLCGAEGRPLAKDDARHARILQELQTMQGRRAKLVEAASRDFPDGKKKEIAGLLAIVLGNFGAHKFYLGLRDEGFWHILFCWTLIPWVISIFEGVNYLQMSRVSFNLSYNVELVLAQIPAESSPAPRAEDIFSMEFTKDEEDFVDEYTEPRTS